MKIKLKVWRQKNKDDKGKFHDYQLNNVNEHMSLLSATIAAKVFAVHAAWLSTANPTGQSAARQPASCICANLKTATR